MQMRVSGVVWWGGDESFHIQSNGYWVILGNIG